jgi:hypothetical protein
MGGVILDLGGVVTLATVSISLFPAGSLLAFWAAAVARQSPLRMAEGNE